MLNLFVILRLSVNFIVNFEYIYRINLHLLSRQMVVQSQLLKCFFNELIEMLVSCAEYII